MLDFQDGASMTERCWESIDDVCPETLGNSDSVDVGKVLTFGWLDGMSDGGRLECFIIDVTAEDGL